MVRGRHDWGHGRRSLKEVIEGGHIEVIEVGHGRGHGVISLITVRQTFESSQRIFFYHIVYLFSSNCID